MYINIQSIYVCMVYIHRRIGNKCTHIPGIKRLFFNIFMWLEKYSKYFFIVLKIKSI